MSIELRRFTTDPAHGCSSTILARFDAIIALGVPPFGEELRLRGLLLEETAPDRVRVVTPPLEDNRNSVALPESWEQAIRDMALDRLDRTNSDAFTLATAGGYEQ